MIKAYANIQVRPEVSRKNDNLYRKSQQRIDVTIREPEVEVDVKQVAAITCVIEDNDVKEDKDATMKDVEMSCHCVMYNTKKLLMMWI